MKRLALLLGLIVPCAAAQPITPYYIWELGATFADISAAPSATDLLEGFPEVTELPANGVLSNEAINESFYSGTFGFIDETNGVYSFLMVDGVCLPMNVGQPSDGFLPPYGALTRLTDGILGGGTDNVLRDYGRAALVVRYGFTNPTDIGAIRVIGGNFNPDGRTFHHYNVWASTDGQGDFGNYFLVARGVKTGPYGVTNAGQWQAALTEVHDFDSKTLIAGCTDLRIEFFCVCNVDGYFMDPWQGNAAEDAEYQASCPDVEPEDTDGRRKAYVGPVVREVDAFAPGEITPWGDINYDGDKDLADFASMQLCASGSTTSGGCFRFDFNEDSVVDVLDLAVFDGLMTGPVN